MTLNEEISRIKKLILELSPESAGVKEFFEVLQKYPELITYLGFKNLDSVKDYIDSWDISEFDELRKEVETFFNEKKDYIKSEMPELERVVEYLNSEENLNVSLQELIELFEKTSETPLGPSILEKLENTDCKNIRKGDLKKAIDISKAYQKTNPKELKKSILSGEYDKPLIINYNGKYHLVAGNTRLCTAMALGITPLVLIVSLDYVEY